MPPKPFIKRHDFRGLLKGLKLHDGALLTRYISRERIAEIHHGNYPTYGAAKAAIHLLLDSITANASTSEQPQAANDTGNLKRMLHKLESTIGVGPDTTIVVTAPSVPPSGGPSTGITKKKRKRPAFFNPQRDRAGRKEKKEWGGLLKPGQDVEVRAACRACRV